MKQLTAQDLLSRLSPTAALLAGAVRQRILQRFPADRERIDGGTLVYPGLGLLLLGRVPPALLLGEPPAGEAGSSDPLDLSDPALPERLEGWIDRRLSPPELLSVEVHHRRGRTHLEQDGTTLYWSHQPAGGWEQERELTPSPADWALFWQALDHGGVWSWRADYCSRGAVDDRGWSVEIAHRGARLWACGGDTAPSAWPHLIEALAGLTGLPIDSGD
ncbi:MAG: hypothetical protein JXX28_04490 [Deltaproteobacteria bacterium]|nr:hypothetical protein [Deltaproteobacteria bacterium]